MEYSEGTGVAPLLTEWILVEAKPEQKLRYYRNIPVVMRGILEIDEVVEEGFVVSLLEMSVEDMEPLDQREIASFYRRACVR